MFKILCLVHHTDILTPLQTQTVISKKHMYHQIITKNIYHEWIRSSISMYISNDIINKWLWCYISCSLFGVKTNHPAAPMNYSCKNRQLLTISSIVDNNNIHTNAVLVSGWRITCLTKWTSQRSRTNDTHR